MFEGNDLDEFLSKARISARTVAIIKREGYETLDDLMRKTDGQLLRAPNFGRGSLNEILYSFKRFGLVGRRADLINNIEE